MRFLIDNAPAQRALASNFPEGSAARHVLDDVDAVDRLESENGVVDIRQVPFSEIGDLAFEVLPDPIGDRNGGLNRARAAALFAWTQDKIWKVSAAKGAVQRALAAGGAGGSPG